MNRSLKSRFIWSLVFVVSCPTFAGSNLVHATQPSPQITIRVYNYVQVSADTLSRMENEASLLLQQAGIPTFWLDCHRSPVQCQKPLAPTDLVLRIVIEPEGGRLSPAGLGFAFATKEGGTLATLFYGRIQKLAEERIASTCQILGYAAAHEMGHLLLSTMTHSPKGIMRANWEREDLGRIAKGILRFTPEQSHLMRADVLTRIQVSSDSFVANGSTM